MLVAGGCTGSAAGSSGGNPSVTSTETGLPPIPADRPKAQMWITPGEDMPFSPYLTASDQAADRLADRVAKDNPDRLTNQEAAIATCMARSGFDYFPIAVSASGERLTVGLPNHYLLVPSLADDRQTVVRVGYGVAEPRPLPTDFADKIDPNNEYYESLSSEGRHSYEVALHGPEQVAYWDGERLDPPVETGGCLGEAYTEFPNPELAAMADLDEFFQLRQDMRFAINMDMFTDPELVDLNREWMACMPSDMTAPLGDLNVVATGPYGGPHGAFALALRTTSDGKTVPLEVPSEELSPEQRALVGSSPEVAIAVADFDCRVQTDYLDRFIAIQSRIEARFVADHKSELDAMMAAAERI
jgi:hypothetical protein